MNKIPGFLFFFLVFILIPHIASGMNIEYFTFKADSELVYQEEEEDLDLFSLGLCWYPTISTMFSDSYINLGYQFKAIGGMMLMEFTLNRWPDQSEISVLLGVGVITKGTGFSFDPDNSPDFGYPINLEAGWSLKYIQIPLYLKYKFWFGFYMGMGVSVDILFESIRWTNLKNDTPINYIEPYNICLGVKIGQDIEIAEDFFLFIEFGLEVQILDTVNQIKFEAETGYTYKIRDQLSFIMPVLGFKYRF